MPDEKLERNIAHLRTLAYPKPGDEGKFTSPPVVRELKWTYPKGLQRATFRLEWTNGVVMTGYLGDVDLYNPRTE